MNKAVDSSSPKILIVEDSKKFRGILSDLLSDENYTILTAESGEKALEVIDREGGNLALILLNSDLPDFNGYQVLDTCLKGKLAPDAKFMVITEQYVSDEELKKLRSVGASGFITQATASKEIILEVNALVKGELRVSSSKAGDSDSPLPVQLDLAPQQEGKGDKPAEYVRNITSSGGFIQTRDPLDVGSKIGFDLPIPGTQEKVHLEGLVTWHKTYNPKDSENAVHGMGINFLFDDKKEEAALEGLLKKLSLKKRVLIVDEDPIASHIVKESLEIAGYSVFTLQNGVDALFITQETVPDLVLMDVEMPDISKKY